jgi:hypothetical protein
LERHLALVIQQPGACRDVLKAVHPGVRLALHRACCPEPESPSVRALSPVPAWWSAQPGALREPQATERGLPWGPVLPSAQAAQQALAQEAVPAVWEPDARQAAPGAAVSVRAVAEPQPGATAASERPAAAEVPGVLQAEEAAASDVTAGRPGVAQREDAAVQPPEAGLQGVREPQAAARRAEAAVPDARRAAVPSVLPLEAASVFRQGPILGSGPARPRAAACLAHAKRSLRTASR